MKYSRSTTFARIETITYNNEPKHPKYIPPSWKATNNYINYSRNQSISPLKENIHEERHILRERVPGELRPRVNLVHTPIRDRIREKELRRSNSIHLQIPDHLKKENIKPGNFKPFRPSFTFTTGDDPRIKKLEEELRKSDLKNNEQKLDFDNRRRVSLTIAKNTGYLKPPSASKKLREDRIAYEKKVEENIKKREINMISYNMKFEKSDKKEIRENELEPKLDNYFNRKIISRTENYFGPEEYISPNFNMSDNRKIEKKCSKNDFSPYPNKKNLVGLQNYSPISASNYETEYQLKENTPEKQNYETRMDSSFDREFMFRSKLLIMNEPDNTERIPVFKPNEFTPCNKKTVIIKRDQDYEITKREDNRISVGHSTLQEIQ